MLRARIAGPIVAVAACTVLTAACGAGAGSGTGTGTTNNRAASSTALELANCMRAHGVPDFPDPGASGGVQAAAAPSSDQAPAFRAAAKACRRFGGGVGGPPHPIPAAQRRKLIAFSQCMRTHGVPGFPDPTFPASGGALISPRQANFNPASPAVHRASGQCGHPLR